MATTAAAAIAAIAARARREIREYLEERNAFDPMSAVRYEPPRQIHARQLEMLVRRGIVKRTSDGAIWLDRAEVEREAEQRSVAFQRLTRFLTFLFILLVIALAFAFLWIR